MKIIMGFRLNQVGQTIKVVLRMNWAVLKQSLPFSPLLSFVKGATKSTNEVLYCIMYIGLALARVQYLWENVLNNLKRSLDTSLYVDWQSCYNTCVNWRVLVV